MKVPADSHEVVMVHEQRTKWIANVRFTNFVLEQKNLSEALPPEMIFLNFMMLKIPYAAKREFLIFCFCHEDIPGEMSGRKRQVVFSLTNILTKDVEV